VVLWHCAVLVLVERQAWRAEEAEEARRWIVRMQTFSSRPWSFDEGGALKSARHMF
jgi:hypothetical protein